MENIKVHISTKTILKVLGVFFAIYVLYLISDILLILFVSLILAALIDPFADLLQSKKIPRAIAVIIIYLVLLSIIALSIVLLTPVIANDLPLLVSNIGNFWVDLQDNHIYQRIVEGTQNIQGTLSGYGFGEGQGAAQVSGGRVENALSGVFSTVTGFFGGVFSVVLTLVMTFYMVVQEDPLKKILRSVVPDEYIPWCSQIMKKMRSKLGAWMRGQLILSLIIGFLVFVGLSIMGIKYAAVLGLLAALFEFVPYIGPVFAAVPALFLAFSHGGFIKLIFVGIMYIIIQQLENHLLVPKVMQKAVGLNPIISIVALLAGAKLAGILGALIAIPVATALSVLLQDVLEKKDKI
jgi:predicted PurR-regulated permease PerM